MPTVYKIISEAEWAKAIERQEFKGAEIDLRDGFIHLSTADQVRETVARHFGGYDDLLILSVNSDLYEEDIKWEPSRGGDLFPHLYRSLPVQDVERVDRLKLDDSGVHLFPEYVPGKPH